MLWESEKNKGDSIDKRADMIPVEWIKRWGMDRCFIAYYERVTRKLIEDWRKETSGEEKPTYIFADDLAKVGNRTVNQEEGSN